MSDSIEDIDSEFEALNQQMLLINEKKLELDRKKREILRERSMEKEVVLTIALSNDLKRVIVTPSTYRADLNTVISLLPSRLYNSYDRSFSVEIDHFEELYKALKEMKNTKINLPDSVSDAIHAVLFAPDYSVGMDTKSFRVKISPRLNYYALTQAIPSTALVKGTLFSIPKVEGWRLAKFLEDKKVLYEPGVWEFITEQIERRNKLVELAKMEDCEYEVNINGFELTGRQKVGAKFIEDAGSCILADPMGGGKSIQSLAPAIKNNERVLIVCPAQLVLNWFYEIKKFTGQNPYIMTGSEPKPFHYIELLTEKKQFNIINYEAIGRMIELETETIDSDGIKHVKKVTKWLWVDLLRQSGFDRVIVDEAHYIKNIDSLRSQATRRLING